MENQLERLENFKYGHKARWCRIFHDNGYGASCWVVEIGTEFGLVTAIESTEFSTHEVPEGVNVFVGGKDGDWAGLLETLKTALDEADKIVATKK